MVEPTRKKDKSRRGADLRSVPKLDLPKSGALVFVTSHPTHPGKLDLTEFVSGTDGPKDKRQTKRWGGDFTGRPEFLHELLPHIHELYGAARHESCLFLTKTLRTYWRLFDRCDAMPEMSPVKSVADLNGVHEATQIRDNIYATVSHKFIALADVARKSAGLPPLHWAVSEKGTGQVRDVLERVQVPAIYNVLKDRVRAIYSAWEADATLVPSKQDSRDILFLLLVKTGWNEATALNIDINNYVRPHPTDAERHILHSIKERAGGTEQNHTARNSQEWAPANLVAKLIERTQPLRLVLKRELAALEEAEGSGNEAYEMKVVEHVSAAEDMTDDTKLRIAWLRNAIRSPWLGQAAHGIANLRSLDSGNDSTRIVVLTQFANGKRISTGGSTPVGQIAEEANLRLPADKKIARITLSDLRDAFIGFAYERSGYQWLMAKLAGGHVSIRSAITYLRSRRFKAHGEGQIRKLGNALLSEIKNRKQVDPAILFALVQRGAITEEQRARWEAGKDRTRMGTGCADFKNPPKSLVPEHVEGTGCRPQRCVLCPYAIVFSDSAPHLARRLAELEWIRADIPVTTWVTSSFDEELETLEQTLDQFPKKVVEGHVAAWQERIRTGRHRPMAFEGAYA